ncbi:MAG: anaerobic ribonucleoside-triphosphate reductase activating protein [Termitinemataceae bacterium]|nr:MAG: anaerobic ribonucleoside-triphosphate reductase activating protein [Termitinemataceae bacterium]
MTQKVYLRKTSLVDYPQKVAAAIFFPMCNLRCPWCQNGSLITNKNDDELITLEEALALIQKRQNVLGAVTLTGGEPTLYPMLANLIEHIKAFSLTTTGGKHQSKLLVKLDTNGTNPDILKQILVNDKTKPDYIAMDLKTSIEKYNSLCRSRINIEDKIIESINIICSSNVQYEFRSLLLPDPFFNKDDVVSISKLKGLNADHWRFRAFIPGSCLDEDWNLKEATKPQTVKDYEDFAKSLGGMR